VIGKVALALGALAGACVDPAAPPACERSLTGRWRTGQVVDGEDLGYHFLDRGPAIEGYPTFKDVPTELPAGVRAAPVAFDLARSASGIAGRWSRRYELASQRCVVSAPARVTRCVGRELVLELGPLAPPADWSACPKPGAAPVAAGPLSTLTLRR
jgi:hypothetical protein